MLKAFYRLFILTSISLFSLMACVSPKITMKPLPAQSAQQRASQLQKLTLWEIRGKIAFIQKIPDQQDKRESVSIWWQVDENNQKQTLDLTSYLGMNVLHLSSIEGEHFLNVDGKEYRSDNLSQLIYSLTGLTLPTQALSFWLKGLPYQATDQLTFDAKTRLPTGITSNYHKASWQITYDKYQVFKQIPMATKFTIKKNGLIIKIAIAQWSFTPKAS